MCYHNAFCIGHPLGCLHSREGSTSTTRTRSYLSPCTLLPSPSLRKFLLHGSLLSGVSALSLQFQSVDSILSKTCLYPVQTPQKPPETCSLPPSAHILITWMPSTKETDSHDTRELVGKAQKRVQVIVKEEELCTAPPPPKKTHTRGGFPPQKADMCTHPEVPTGTLPQPLWRSPPPPKKTCRFVLRRLDHGESYDDKNIHDTATVAMANSFMHDKTDLWREYNARVLGMYHQIYVRKSCKGGQPRCTFGDNQILYLFKLLHCAAVQRLRGSVSAQGARRATFSATCDSYPCFGGGFYPSDGWVSGWVGGWVGWGQFGMISPRGLAPFQLRMWNGPFPSPIVP